MTTPADIGARLAELGAWLDRHRPLWEPRPFTEQPVGWESEYPAVSSFLRSLDEDGIDRVQRGIPERGVEAPAVFMQWLESAHRLAALPRLDAPSAPPLDSARLKWRVPGRKWTQVSAFTELVLDRAPDGMRRILDWCAGKGHLGRTLSAVSRRPATLLERRASLRERAERLAARVGTPVEFRRGDVLEPADVVDAIDDTTLAVGLHACGSLGDALLEHGAAAETPLTALATCCYHVFAPDEDEPFAPRSEVGRRHDLTLTQDQLKLAIYDEVVAADRERRWRRREMAWRAGFDLLRREASGEDRYVSLGVLPRRVLKLPFGEFCREVSEMTGHPLPERWRASAAQRAGEAWARRARALGMVRAIFRRPLEVWLVLDRAQRQVELGRSVEVGVFCARGTTPRNIALLSYR